MPKPTRTTEQFIQESMLLHKDTYDYSKVIYINTCTPVIITCKQHGDFLSHIANHLKGHGCAKCAFEKSRMTRDEFIKKSILKHGEGTYDYSKVIYQNGKTKVEIICKIHGPFLQAATSHLEGKGCYSCGHQICVANQRKSREKFIEEAQQIHKNKYTYEKVNYENTSSKVIITCFIHGDFLQSPLSHIQGSGCRSCGYQTIGERSRKTTEQYIESAKKIHGEKYDYSTVDYSYSYNKVTITCKHHGEFSLKASSHLSGNGCFKCNPKGYSKKQLEWLEFISSMYGLNIQTAINGGEKQIGRYLVDGYCFLNNTVYEYHGDFWHGSPKYYKSEAINVVSGKSFGELYRNTLIKEQYIKEQGYKLVVIWDSEWKDFIKIIKRIQRNWRRKHYNPNLQTVKSKIQMSGNYQDDNVSITLQDSDTDISIAYESD